MSRERTSDNGVIFQKDHENQYYEKEILIGFRMMFHQRKSLNCIFPGIFWNGLVVQQAFYSTATLVLGISMRLSEKPVQYPFTQIVLDFLSMDLRDMHLINSSSVMMVSKPTLNQTHWKGRHLPSSPLILLGQWCLALEEVYVDTGLSFQNLGINLKNLFQPTWMPKICVCILYDYFIFWIVYHFIK